MNTVLTIYKVLAIGIGGLLVLSSGPFIVLLLGSFFGTIGCILGFLFVIIITIPASALYLDWAGKLDI